MRTTIDLNDEILRRVKRRAADQGVPLRHIVETALRDHLARERAGARRYTLQWRAESGRVQSGVRLDDRDALFDLMDGRG